MDASDVLDFDFGDVPETVASPVGSKRRLKKAERASRSKSATIVSNSEAFRLAELKTQDPAVLAHFLADHFVAKESSTAASKPPPVKQSARPAAGAVGLGSFRSWQFGERCLATYRVLFGRPLWSTTSSPPSTSPRPRKRKHVTPPTSSSSDSDLGNADQLEVDAFELETDVANELLSLPTVDELLELQGDEIPLPEIMDEEEKPQEAVNAEDVLAALTMELDDGLDVATGTDTTDLLWDLDAAAVSGVDTGLLLTEGEEEELRFLASSPHCFGVESPDIEDMDQT